MKEGGKDVVGGVEGEAGEGEEGKRICTVL